MNLNRMEIEYLIERTLHDMRVGRKKNDLDLNGLLGKLKGIYPKTQQDFKKCRDAITHILSRWELGSPQDIYNMYIGMSKNVKWKLSTFERETSRMKGKGLIRKNNGKLVLYEAN